MKKLKTAGILIFCFLLSLSTVACGERGASDSTGNGSPVNSDSVGGNSSSGNTAEQQREINEALAKLSDQEFTYAQLAGTDALGRKTLPTVGNAKKYVGLFYFVATGYVNTTPWEYSVHDKIYDITKLLAEYGNDKLTNPVMALSTGVTAPYYDPEISPEGLAHFWGEPLYGYYRSDDPWVVRKHLELFMNAGIDFLYLDYTNNIIYPDATKALLDAILEMQQEGYQNVPKVVPMMSYNAGWCSATFRNVYSTYFQDDTYDSCWFRADEELNPAQKPLIIGNLSSTETNYDEFWVKNIQWPSEIFDPDAVPWMDWGLVQKNHNGVMVVTVSQGGASSSEAYFEPDSTRYQARGYNLRKPDEHGIDEEGVLSGRNFEFKWDNAVKAKDDLDIVTVTGWNEWIVRKLADNDPAATHYGYGEYVDSFTMAYSRDAEMMKGGYGDNYYMQLARNIRRFKGRTVEGSDNVAATGRETIVIDRLSEWDKISRRYLDLGTSTRARNYTAVDRSIPYKTSARNDIEYLKICNDAKNLYVAVTAKDHVTPYRSGDTGWMNLYLSTGASAGWENYNFLVNRNPDTDSGKTSVESFTGTGSQTKAAGTAEFFVSGKTIVYSIPLSALGVKAGAVVEIKATDHLQKFGDVDDFYISGESAPMGRLNYAYKIA